MNDDGSCPFCGSFMCECDFEEIAREMEQVRRERDEARRIAFWLRDWMLELLERHHYESDGKHIWHAMDEMEWFQTEEYKKDMEHMRLVDECLKKYHAEKDKRDE